VVDARIMVVRLLRQLAALAVAAAIVSLVTGHLGTSLAARSMSGYVVAFDAAQSGSTARADSLGADLSLQWHALAGSIGAAVETLESTLDQLAPGR
jgi:hypothetical protein